MKSFVCAGFILLLATQSHAETYSWVDDGGTYNFTEDYSRVPKKYRKNVKRRDDVLQDTAPQVTTLPENITKKDTGKGETKPVAVSDGEKELYGGKSRAAWRQEMGVLEAELGVLEQRMELLRKNINTTKVESKTQFVEMRKEYEESRIAYQQKYKSYTELIETIRKAGLPVEIKK